LKCQEAISKGAAHCRHTTKKTAREKHVQANHWLPIAIHNARQKQKEVTHGEKSRIGAQRWLFRKAGNKLREAHQGLP